MKLRFTPRARDDLVEIADFLRERNPRAALQVRAAILNSLQMIARYPSAGRLQTTARIRKLGGASIPISRLLHAARPGDNRFLSVKHAARRREYDDG